MLYIYIHTHTRTHAPVYSTYRIYVGGGAVPQLGVRHDLGCMVLVQNSDWNDRVKNTWPLLVCDCSRLRL